MPTAKAYRLTPPMVSKALCSSTWIWLLPWISVPNKCLSWLSPMMMAAAEVKPLMTGRERKSTKKPILSTPRSNWIDPMNKARKMAMAIYSSIPESDSAPRPEATIMESMATGPTASCREVPKKAYTTCGTRAA